MAEKGNDRSNAKISDEDIMRILQKKGVVKVFAEDHKVFSTDEERAKIIEGCTKAEIGCIECKKILINNVENFICPIREKKKVLDKEIQNIDEFLAPSQKKANDFAAILMEKVRKAIKI